MERADVRPLILWGDFTPEMMQMLKAAKDQLGVDWFVKPRRADPGTVGNVIATEWPPFYVDGGIALLTPPYSTARMERAMRQVYGLEEPKNLKTRADWISRAIGGEVRELEGGDD